MKTKLKCPRCSFVTYKNEKEMAELHKRLEDGEDWIGCPVCGRYLKVEK